jgi:NADPH:quinone reductase-like Zn-dependent oxidoreductase
MIIKTLAVALAPGDCRVLSGKTREFQGPPSFPYIPAGDCCGIVVELPEMKDKDECYFKIGDVVAARFTNAPRDAMAEYAVVSTSVTEKVDPTANISPEEAAALASASPATITCDHVRPGERILILGAGGGIGSHACQLARVVHGASYICGVSNDAERLLRAPLSCDDAIDYTEDIVFDSKKYQEDPFDTIIDLASGGWPQLVQHKKDKIPSIVKPANKGGRFLTMCPDVATYEAHSIWKILGMFLIRPLTRAITSRLFTRRSLPKFTMAMGLPDGREVMTR